MKLPVYGYGNNVLKMTADKVEQDYPGLDTLIADMWETMENAQGCGLAAPQIGKPLQLFVADSKVLFDNMDETERKDFYTEGDRGIREVFINTELVSLSENKWEETEGCLSLPFLSGKVVRSWSVEVQYQNQHFETIQKKFSGMTARVILHEYDHTQGILYIDRVKPLSKKLMESKLKQVLKGNVTTPYKMKFKN
ncbi:Peptide deformylase [Elizabethkingia anophelis]|uniref:peptide deformylase n=1 Tax=Elizabethkingia anophelis TaxID=1117645 RepID=UPI0020B6DB10|nr:peptide deformylase [Elizabethkingia anophelis]UTG65288.1 peptide deformylase [Elizabethkingia anophelis]CAH1152354.1 Peptide deformylase [Elizabethkingia anophelis]CAI9686882.1 Peptide deformylase [Elizabethkingia anophelis]